jgi:hypothetical protein
MFGIGMIENMSKALICVILGFEFESKITPFGANNFIENIMVFFVVGSLSFLGLHEKEHFRLYLIILMLFGIFSLSILYLVKFKI